MDDIQSKHCAVCHEPFIPDKRVGARQLVCFKLNCQQERKRRSQRRWVSQNPGYFRERYPYVKAWLAAHPGYLRQYRARKKASFDIQDELTFCKSNMLRALQRSLDIQDEISSKITKSKKQLKMLTAVIYKTSEPLVFTAG
ncbi:MAG: hypothetical protein ACE5G1_11025 [bacterium]